MQRKNFDLINEWIKRSNSNKKAKLKSQKSEQSLLSYSVSLLVSQAPQIIQAAIAAAAVAAAAATHKWNTKPA